MDLCLFQFGFDDDEFKHADCDARHRELRPSGMIQRRAENLDAMAMGRCNTWPSSVVLPQYVLGQTLGCFCLIVVIFGPRAATVFFCLIVIAFGPRASAVFSVCL